MTHGIFMFFCFLKNLHNSRNELTCYGDITFSFGEWRASAGVGSVLSFWNICDGHVSYFFFSFWFVVMQIYNMLCVCCSSCSSRQLFQGSDLAVCWLELILATAPSSLCLFLFLYIFRVFFLFFCFCLFWRRTCTRRFSLTLFQHLSQLLPHTP